MDHVTSLHFAWPFECQGDFPARQKCVYLYVEFVHLHLTSIFFFNFQMNKIWDVMLVPYYKEIKLRIFLLTFDVFLS